MRMHKKQYSLVWYILITQAFFLFFFSFYFWCHISACKFVHAYFSFIIKNGCHAQHVLGFKTVVLSYRSYNLQLKYSKWKEKALKNAQQQLEWKKKSFKR